MIIQVINWAERVRIYEHLLDYNIKIYEFGMDWGSYQFKNTIFFLFIAHTAKVIIIIYFNDLTNVKYAMKDSWKIIKGREFRELAFSLGRPIGSRLNSALIDELMPKSIQDARKDSISSKIGLGMMPFHTDCAYYKTPPRILLLKNEEINSDCATLLIDLNEINFTRVEQDYLRNGLWICFGQKSKFLSSIYNENFFRWDTYCMRPMNKMAKEAFKIMNNIISKISPKKFYWDNKEEILLIDNWNVLHAREKCEGKRKLKRILVEATHLGG
jgi:hypothetical protein